MRLVLERVLFITMSISLKPLFEEIYQAKDEDNLRSYLAPKIGVYFTAKQSGIFFFNRLLAERKLQPVLNLALSLEHNPVARHIAERHTSVHDGLVTTPKAWKVICPRSAHWHVMAVPILFRRLYYWYNWLYLRSRNVCFQ